MKKNNRLITHRYLGHMSSHHLIPRERIRSYYGETLTLPNNLLRLWRLKHDAWHILFGNKTLNEILKHLKKRSSDIYGYKTLTWKILFREKTKKEVFRLLLRVRRVIRKKYAFLEFDPKLKEKVDRIRHYADANKSRDYLLKRFKKTA